MATAGERIKALREENHLSGEKFGEMFGVTRQHISQIENDKKLPGQELAQKICEHFNLDLDYLYGRTEIKNKYQYDELFKAGFEAGKNSISNLIPVPPTKSIPMLGEIACGEPIYADQDVTFVPGPIEADFCLRAKGDSMTGARIYDGDFVFIKRQEMVQNGEIAAVIIGDEATLKRFWYYEQKNLLILKAENRNYEDLIYSGEDLNSVRVLGKAIAFQSAL